MKLCALARKFKTDIVYQFFVCVASDALNFCASARKFKTAALDTDDFRIVSIEMVDGKPKVEWEPKVNRWTGAEVNTVLKGAATLDGD